MQLRKIADDYEPTIACCKSSRPRIAPIRTTAWQAVEFFGGAPKQAGSLFYFIPRALGLDPEHANRRFRCSSRDAYVKTGLRATMHPDRLSNQQRSSLRASHHPFVPTCDKQA